MTPSRHIRVLAGASLSALAALAVALPAWADTEPSGVTADAPLSGGEAQAGTGSDQAGATDSPSPGDRGGAERTAAEASGTDGTAGTAGRRDRRRFGERTLREGHRGRDVSRLQKILRHLNFTVRVTGRYNRDTKRQVRRFDLWKEKKVNGVVHMKQAERMKSLEKRGARYRAHVFPVRGPHDYGGSGSRFGAPRSGHTHQGQDVAAAEGTKLVAVHEGRVAYRQYQAGGAGYYLVIRGRDGADSVYMHLREEARVRPGQRVMAGQKIGRVGTTGSSTGPHLHFELWTPRWYDGGSAYDPLRKLQRWDRRT